MANRDSSWEYRSKRLLPIVEACSRREKKQSVMLIASAAEGDKHG
jgi:hypothetical protein